MIGRLLDQMAINGKIERSQRADRRGATAVEFAIVAPIFFLFLLASFEFGWLNVLRHTADNAAYEAARTAMVPGGTAAEATAKANAILKIVGARDAVVTVTPSVLTSETAKITVTIGIPLKNNVLVLPKFTDKLTLHSEATMRTERAK